MSALSSGSRIDGFCLGEMIHTGSMASIYRLTGPSGPLPLVMKIPRLGPGERAVNVVGFEVCRMVLGALAQGPHHPTLVAYGDVETVPYLVMEWVEGTRLNDWVPRAPLPPEEIARLGSAFALALQDIHRQDVVHLDLKPTNVLYRAGGEAVIVDFGLAHHSHFPDLLSEELRFPVGNWVYMSPEQTLGVRCDPRSDVYALGSILYELATGQLPFGRPRSIAELRKRLYCDPVPPRAIVPATPEWLQEIILHCLEVDARKRYASAEQVAFDLTNPSGVVLTERGSRQRRSGWGTRLKRRLRAVRFEPAPCPPPVRQSRSVSVIVAAIALREANRLLNEALRRAARSVCVADSDCRIACVTVVPPATALSDEGEENSATGRHIRCLVELRRWAKPLELPEERVTYHVLESDKPAAALVDYAKMNDVSQMLLGAPRSGGSRLIAGVCAHVVAEAPCTVTVVRPRSED
ncbi:MAG TPA: bifunctional serine/threonine-protein kinase/universal stress protein [Burkholderiales bacterium]